MTSDYLRQKFIDFCISKGHKQIPPAPLVPENDPTTLFTSSGMQQLVPYLKGEIHPMGKRLTNSQICFRAEDIDEIGDNRHTTFFEMLGNWSLGDPASPDGIGKAGYFKKEQLTWFWEFLTQIVGLDPNRLYVSVFEGNKVIPQDTESISLWQKLFATKNSPQSGKKGFDPKIKIYTYSVEQNWWSRSGPPDKMPAGEIGGPDSEVFFDFDPDNKLKIHQKSAYKNKLCQLNCQCGRFLEIGNSVFMEYQKTKTGFKKLPQKNVDFGGGLERILAAKLDTPDVFKTALFWPIIQEIEKACAKKYEGNENAMRIIADHLKAAVFIINAGVEPSNKLQGYILRRLLRRSAVKMRELKSGLTPNFSSLCFAVIRIYRNYLIKETEIRNKIDIVVNQEMDKFAQSLERGLKELKKASDNQLNALFAFNLFQTYGFPPEISQELFRQRKKSFDKKEFENIYLKHQQLSRTTSKGMFKGGLADHSEKITKLHTATHLLHAALRKVLGNHVKQVGSNITAERLRFDFTHHQLLTGAEIKKVEELVNQQIKNNLKIESQTMSLVAAQKQKALAFFGQRYPEKVKVYSIGSFSKEVCNGPHFDFTGSLGKFKIKKEKSCGSGKRRIYAVLE